MNLHTYHCAAARFEAARQLTALPEGHRARGLHGHGFVAKVRCRLPAGWAEFPGAEVGQLQALLAAQAQRLDHGLLNQHLDQPSDENLARWLQTQLALPGPVQLGVHSTPRQGVDLDAAGQAHVWRRHAFQSAHRLPHVPPGHQCGRMHGHGFEVILQARQEPAGPTIDHELLDRVWAPLQQLLDMACLNDLPGLDNPTSELLSSWLWARIQPQLPQLSGITVFETGSCGAHFDGQGYRIWKTLTLDSAVRLKRAPDHSALRRLHGHTYTLRLHLTAPLDQLMGWTVDFGDVKTLFNPIFKALDHQPLHELPGLDDGDTATLAHWILRRGRAELPALSRVDLEETPGCGAVALWGTGHPSLPL